MMKILNYIKTFRAWLKSLRPWFGSMKKRHSTNRSCFGLSYAFRMDLVEIEKKVAHRWSDVWRAYRHEHNVVENYLKNNGYLDLMVEIIRKEDSDSIDDIIGNNCPIWVSWWQGSDSMPPIVKKCYERLLKMRGNHTVVLVTRENYDKYVDIPKQLVDKAESGTMMYAHLADLLRLKLLAKHGGLWIDSTVFCSHSIDDVYTNCKFISLRNPSFSNESVTYYRWTSFFMGSTANAYVKALACAMEHFLMTEKKVIHYLLIDYLIDLLYQNSDVFRQMIDSLPLRNPDLHKLIPLLNWGFEQSVWNKLMEDNDFFKTTYRGNWADSVDGKKTYYRHILDLN